MDELAGLEPLETDPPEPNGAPTSDDPAGQGWRLHKNGRWFTPARGRGGMVFREGSETIEEAHARDAKGPKDKKPRPKKPPGSGKLPPAPTEVSLKELEYELAQALSAPSDIVAAMGDEWMADHFAQQGPRLARQLVVASRTNPWLRAKLEAAALGGDDMLIRIIMSVGVAGALVGYALPPLVYYVNPPFISDRARELYRIPERKTVQQSRQEPAHAGPENPPPAGPVQPAAAAVAA